MDLFNRNNINECTKTDFLDTNVHKNSKDHAKDKKMLHKLARSRLKQQLKKKWMPSVKAKPLPLWPVRYCTGGITDYGK